MYTVLVVNRLFYFIKLVHYNVHLSIGMFEALRNSGSVCMEDGIRYSKCMHGPSVP